MENTEIDIETRKKFKTNIKKMKEELKSLVPRIRTSKKQFKDKQRSGEEFRWDEFQDMWIDKYNFRHLHIAYCELRGRTREQIEPKVHESNLADESRIRIIKEKFHSELNV